MRVIKTVNSMETGAVWMIGIVLFLVGQLIQGAPVSIWPPGAVPGLADGGADSSVELGLKFRSDTAGTVTAIRFYKAAANTGTHVGSLWTAAGTRLASATFINETSSGWQQVNLTTPVSIAANTTYVVSYHAANGHYSADVDYFAKSGIDNVPLHALAAGVSGGNGVYAYNSAVTFPSSTWKSPNYWVDVVFSAGSQGDTTAPVVSQISTGSGPTGVSTAAVLNVRFNEALNAATVNTNTILIKDSSGVVAAATVSYSAQDFSATLTPSAPLKAATNYNLLIKGGSAGVADVAGNYLSADFTWAFSTQTYGAKGGGPGGPILIITDKANPFSEYYAEILLAEGLNEFALMDIAGLSDAAVAPYDVVVLGQINLSAAQVTILTNWVTAGGKLIAARPDQKLLALLGLNATGGTLAEGYLLVNTASGPGVGIVGETIQFHGVADLYSLGAASSLATLYSGAQTATSSPAVTSRSVGSKGGQAVAFAYDLARSVVYTRQGNPAWVGQNRDGLSPMRANDLFYGAASFDPRPDWIDMRKVAIPQADEQQRFFSNLIITMNSERRLLPRFWYFPDGHRAVVVMTGDDHANGGTAGRFDQYKAASKAGASVDGWQAIRGTSYVYPNEPMTDAQASAYVSAGFEIGLHLYTGCADYTPQQLDGMFTEQLIDWKVRFPSLPSPVTNRVHCISWCGYTILPEIGLPHGIRLDTSYYYFPPEWVADRPGFFTGSGMPMRFATEAGNALDVYQAVTQMTDESNQSYPYTVDTLLDRAVGAEGFYGAIVANMHTDFAASSGSDAIVSSAKARGVPVISARQLLTWIDARNSSAFRSVTWSNGTLTYTVEAGANANGLRTMVPLPTGKSPFSVKFNGNPIQYTESQVKGITYLQLASSSGRYEISFNQDTAAPTVLEVRPSSGQTNVPVNVKPVVVFDKTMNAGTINSNTVMLTDSSNVAVPAAVTYSGTASEATLTPSDPLKVSTVYTLTIKGGASGVADTSGNVLANNYSVSFITAAQSFSTISLWTTNFTPAVTGFGDPNSVTLGVKFQSTIAGNVTGVRFYKDSRNIGPHEGVLWSASGTALATVTFANETDSGWQSQKFATPVPISANTTYIISYFAPSGQYAANVGYFATAGRNNYPLRAPADSATEHNGVYRYGGKAAFPSQSANAANYWVDVIVEASF